MVNRFILTVSLMLCALLCKAQQSHVYKCVKSNVTFFSETPVENIEASTQQMNAALNSQNQNVAAVILIKSFKFNNAFMEEHFNEKYMESDRYPKATFTGIITEPVDFSKAGSYRVTISGKLNLHGIEQPRTISADLVIDQAHHIQLHAVFNVKLIDHHIEVPTLVIQKVAETIKVTIDATLQ